MSDKKVISKLIRDRIPEFLKTQNITCHTTVLDDESYQQALHTKLQEEVTEFLEAKSNTHKLEEMADILEVLRACLALQGNSFEQLESIRKIKEQERGGFYKKLFTTFEK